MKELESDSSDSNYKLYAVSPVACENDYPTSRDSPLGSRIGHWGYLGYYVPAGLMHTQDAARFLKTQSEENIYCCIREEPPVVVVQNNVGNEYRVNPERFLWIPAPSFQLGDQVQTKVGTFRVGWIAERVWHRKDRRFFYLISIEINKGRKLHTRRYFEDGLQLCPIV